MIRPAIVALALLLGCNGNGNPNAHATPAVSAPVPSSSPTAPSSNAPQAYTLSVVGSSTITGPVGLLAGPVAVLVTDAAGKPADGVNVAFRATSAQPPSWGPWGLGDTLSGDGMWTISGPGTGIAAVGATPVVVGACQVSATVVPVVASYKTPSASSNTVTFEVLGQ